MGCSTSNYADEPGSSCTISLEGYDRDGICVGRESYNYTAIVEQPYVPPYWLMGVYNTTKGGLKGKYLQNLSITITAAGAGASDPGYEVGIYGVSYTVFNKTTCG